MKAFWNCAKEDLKGDRLWAWVCKYVINKVLPFIIMSTWVAILLKWILAKRG